MDFPYMVRTRSLILNVIQAPAFHFIILGGILYFFTAYQAATDKSHKNKPSQYIIPRYQIERAEYEFFQVNSRFPDIKEKAVIYDTLLEHEVFYQYALFLGLDKQPVVEQRLAQVADFVEENPEEGESPQSMPKQDDLFDLREGDLVIRRMMVDGARRLIRAGILSRNPDDELLQAYLNSHPKEFQRPERTKLTHIVFNHFTHGINTEAKAAKALRLIQNKSLSLEQALKLGDEFWIPASIPLSSDQDLIRDFNQDFTRAINSIPLNTWSGPINSRYGSHLVFIEQRLPAYVPPLADIKREVKKRLLQKLADEWLSLRLQQLKQEFKVVVQ